MNDPVSAHLLNILLQSEFLQFTLLSSDDFLKFLVNCGIEITLEELEYYDKKDIIRPALRLYRQKIDQPGQKYATILSDNFYFKQYYNQGSVELPKEGDFKSWDNYRDGTDIAVELYYHKYQFVPVRQLISGNRTTLSPQYFENIVDFQKSLEKRKERLEKIIKITQKSSKNWTCKVGLLMLLDEAYGPYINGLKIVNNPELNENDFLHKWNSWRFSKFRPEHILETAGMSREETKSWYNELVRLGYDIDPLSNWFPLLQLINAAKKKKLEKEALLAQEYYKLAKMVAFFIYDLTKEKMPDPDDLMDGNHGSWKRVVYGERFDYQTRQTQQSIWDNYSIDRPFRIVLIYEGDTEDTVIRMIFDALYVDQERDGVFLQNAKGQGNIKKNLSAAIELAKANGTDVFLLLDRDANWSEIINDFRKKGYLRNGMYHVWKKDFESDNFSIYEIVEKVNHVLMQNSYHPIEREKLTSKMNNPKMNVTKAISDLIWEKNRVKMNEVISKKRLGKILILNRIAEIRKERSGEGWKPLLPIEEILHKIFDYMIPRYIG